MTRIHGACALFFVLAAAVSGTVAGSSDGEVSHPELRSKLMALYERDQAARGDLLTLLPEKPSAGGDVNLENPTMEQIGILMKVKAVDVESTAFMRQVVEEHGFPTISMVGEDGAHAAWILVQHADANREFQQRVLALMEPLVETGEVDRSNFAHLTDRVLLATGEPQRFGTQFARDADGVLRPRPTESTETLDRRRAAHGLLPLARHAAFMAQELEIDVSPEPMESQP